MGNFCIHPERNYWKTTPKSQIEISGRTLEKLCRNPARNSDRNSRGYILWQRPIEKNLAEIMRGTVVEVSETTMRNLDRTPKKNRKEPLIISWNLREICQEFNGGIAVESKEEFGKVRIITY